MTGMTDFAVVTASEQETFRLGSALGLCLKQGDVVALSGELGSGKTWFTKGIAQGLGIVSTTNVTSPSFALVNEYPGKTTLFHIDVYRLESLHELRSAGIDEYLDQGGVAVIEWADRWPEILPFGALRIEFVILDECSRRISFSALHGRSESILQALKKARKR